MTGIGVYTIGTILSLQTLCTCVISTIGQYFYIYYLGIYTPPSNSTYNWSTISPGSSSNFLKQFNDETKRCIDSDVSFDNDAQAWAQEKSADLFFWTSLVNSCPLIIMTYILGLYTPKLGKCFVLILPMIGILAQFAIWLAIIYFHLPDYWWYIAAAIVGASGSTGILSFVLTLIITDNTHENDLSSRCVYLGALQTGVSAVGIFAIGYYIDWRGFTDLCWIGLGLEVLSILVVLCAFKKSSSNLNERTPLLNSPNENDFKELSPNTCSHFFQACTVFHSSRRNSKKSASLLLTLISNMFYTLASTTFAPFVWFLLNAPFCWSSQNIGNYSAFAAISYAILSVLGMQALTQAGASDAVICLISHMFFLASNLWLAFASSAWELYAGLLVSAFSGYQGSLTMSMMAKWLAPHERPHAFTLVTEINTIMTTFGTTFFTWVYARTVANYRNLTFLIGAGLCIIPTILNLCLALLTRKMSDEELPPLSENEVEPAPVRLPNNGPPHAGDATCIVIPSRSLTSSMRTPVLDRSRHNSIDENEPEEVINSSTDDLITF
ncbi:unnamed protein product [Rotaria magnacalcarata]|uniref:Proton-coupled folate transporter n=1 Tax=Rotaria magnacalcarata TaxID=392030 RepID=A0A816R597_9BILA|nr:unnamed protein product [Rotaria magnacalcarata]CAF2055418.1 unnamed protein product [Rotaria magnacalcarata]CAF2066855.1 unnamed protein product [Rotaria magnacalcarata]